MCGIAGYLGSRTIPQNILRHALSLMERRGPDGSNIGEMHIDNQACYFLHSRLSIIDLEARANQPFCYNQKTLIYNGEIYNYIEVREDLKKRGHHFNTNSDTEVLIHAIDEWGALEALNRVEGMWAFALFDNRTKKLILSRDPFGEKPLYLYEPAPGEIYFGSEIKFLAALAGVKFTPNRDHLIRFLVNGYKSLYKNNINFFNEITELPKSSYREIDITSGRSIVKKYWHPKIQMNAALSFKEATAMAKELLISSVKSRLRADIPIAFCMSGGVDSNALISIAKRIFNYDVHGFTILNADKRYEEEDMVNIGVSELGIKHSGYPVSSDCFIENLKTLVAYHDAPVLTITYYLDWQLQQAIAEHGYHVSVSGTAADELFSGYFDHQLMYLYDVRQDENLFNESIQHWQREVAPFVRNPCLQQPTAFIDNPFSRDHAYLDNDKYATYLHQPWQEAFSEIYFRDGLLQNRMMNEIFHETTPVILHEIDLNSMFHSVENRSPFLDRKLFEFCHSIPAKHLIQNGAAKAVLREAMRGIVPDAILNSKRKVGFNAPIMDLLNIRSQSVMDYLLKDSPIWDFLKKDKIMALLENAHLPNSDSKFIFSFLTSKIFLEEFS